MLQAADALLAVPLSALRSEGEAEHHLEPPAVLTAAADAGIHVRVLHDHGSIAPQRRRHAAHRRHSSLTLRPVREIQARWDVVKAAPRAARELDADGTAPFYIERPSR